MRNIALGLLAATLAMLVLSACGSTVHPVSAPVNAPDYHVEYVPYHGHTLVCIIKNVGGSSSASWGGPSCDWALYHHDYGYNGVRP